MSFTSKAKVQVSQICPVKKEIFDTWKPISHLEKAAKEVGNPVDVTDAATLKASNDMFQSELEPFKTLLEMVKSAVSAYRRAKTTFDREMQNQERKKQNQAGKVKSGKAQTGAGKRGGEGLPDRSQCPIFDADFSMHLCVPEKASSEARFDFEIPWVRHSSELVDKTAVMSPAKLNLLVFKASLGKSEKKRDVKKLTKSAPVRDCLLQGAGLIADDLVLNDHQRVMDVYLWGSKKGSESVNCEMNSWATVRAVTSDSVQMQIVLMDFRAMQAHMAAEGVGEQTKLNVGHIKNFFGEPNTLQDRVAGVPRGVIYHTELSEKSLLYVPTGWVVAERCLSPTAFGMVASLLPKAPSAVVELRALESMITSSGLASAGESASILAFMKESIQALVDAGVIVVGCAEGGRAVGAEEEAAKNKAKEEAPEEEEAAAAEDEAPKEEEEAAAEAPEEKEAQKKDAEVEEAPEAAAAAAAKAADSAPADLD